MSDKVLEHSLIRDYLRELSAACVTLPTAQARELREQITAHLDEALSAGAAESEVRAELARLGTPRSLAAEAAGPGRRPIARRLLSRLDRVRWWTWVSVAVLTALLGPALAYVLLALNATPLSEASVSGWYYPQDQKLSVETRAGDATQLTVPERFGQDQGILIGVVNNSDWTQTVLGAGPNWPLFSRLPVQIAVGSGKWVDQGGSNAGPVRWSSPGSIPPHSYRLVRVLWKSTVCNMAGGWTSTRWLVLTVRVGTFTRTENIPLEDSWAIAGNKSSDCH